MRFEFKARTERMIEEDFDIEVDAEDIEEGQDLAYEIISVYPNSNLVARRLLRTAVFYHEPDHIEIRFPQEEDDDEEDDPDGGGTPMPVGDNDASLQEAVAASA